MEGERRLSSAGLLGLDGERRLSYVGLTGEQTNSENVIPKIELHLPKTESHEDLPPEAKISIADTESKLDL